MDGCRYVMDEWMDVDLSWMDELMGGWIDRCMVDE